MLKDGKIWAARSERDLVLLPNMANRHGLIAGATGTGKTITMKVLAESFSALGVPVFLADVKGDLSGMCVQGARSESVDRRASALGMDAFEMKAFPTRFWDVFGERGVPARITVSDIGPVLLARLLKLTDVQAGVLNIAFRAADDQGLLLLDLKDLRAMLAYVSDNRQEYTALYGNVSTASVGAIQRALLAFEEEDGQMLFGEPALDIRDWMRTDIDGRGYINILNAARLIRNPTTYSTFLLWMLTELFERLPEVGDPEKPRLVFFFDEAHLLFDDAPKALVQKIAQVVRLIRSKGVGVYFVTQCPSDIPDDVLSQLSNRIQHALRAYTPAEQKSIRATAQAFRANPAFDTEKALMELGVGEALVSFLDAQGVPEIVERALILPPQSRMGAAEDETVQRIIRTDEFDIKYREAVDRESAYEILTRAAEALARQEDAEEAPVNSAKSDRERLMEKSAASGKKRGQGIGVFERAATNAASSVARSVSTNLVNSVLGGRRASAGTIAKRAATNALSSVMRSGSTSLIRGLFGNKK